MKGIIFIHLTKSVFYFLPEKKTKFTEKKAENNPKIARERLFFPREDFRKYTPEKPKIVPEKKNEKL